jgi:peptidoglycan/LPS O-acetylase OafA/YrhL
VTALGHRPALDGVRAIAVALVVLGPVDDILLPGGRDPLPGGFLGVDVFFVLSGFLITRLLLDERTTTGRVSLGGFYLRRAARLLPAVALLLVGHALWVTFADVGVTRAMEVDSLLVVGLYVSNWANQLHRDLAFGLGHLWSLSVEEQFYLVWPFLIWATRRRPGWLWAVIGIGVGVAVGVRHHLWAGDVHWLLIYIRTDARMDSLLVGCALGLAHHRGWLDRVATPVRRTVGGAGLAVVVGSALAFQPDRSVLYGAGFTAIAAASAALIAAVLEPGWWLHRWLSLRPLRALGRVSYGVYLWHVPVFLAVAHAWPDGPGAAVVAVALLTTSVAVVASWTVVERPVSVWSRARHARGAPTGVPAVAASALP